MPFPLPDDRLLAMLREDVPYGDATTQGLGISELAGQAIFLNRSTMVASCIEEAERIMLLAGCRSVQRFHSSGAQVEEGSELLLAEGSAAALHRGMKVAQALMEVASGVATRARRILLAAREGKPNIAVTCTRKHLPGTKDVMLKAIIAGGCAPHRLGLSDSVLVFPQHRAFLGRKPPYLWVAELRASQPERKISVEAESVDEVTWFASAGVDCVQVEKLSPAQIAEAVRAMSGMAKRPMIAATGGVNESNARAYAEAGADLLVTSAPYAAPPAEVSVRMSIAT